MGNGQFGAYFLGSTPANTIDSPSTTHEYDRVLYKAGPGRFPRSAESFAVTPSITTQPFAITSVGKTGKNGLHAGTPGLQNFSPNFSSGFNERSNLMGNKGISFGARHSDYPRVTNLAYKHNPYHRYHDDFQLNYYENHCTIASMPPNMSDWRTTGGIATNNNTSALPLRSFSDCGVPVTTFNEPPVRTPLLFEDKYAKGSQTDPSPWILYNGMDNGKFMAVTAKNTPKLKDVMPPVPDASLFGNTGSTSTFLYQHGLPKEPGKTGAYSSVPPQDNFKDPFTTGTGRTVSQKSLLQEESQLDLPPQRKPARGKGNQREVGLDGQPISQNRKSRKSIKPKTKKKTNAQKLSEAVRLLSPGKIVRAPQINPSKFRNSISTLQGSGMDNIKKDPGRYSSRDLRGRSQASLPAGLKQEFVLDSESSQDLLVQGESSSLFPPLKKGKKQRLGNQNTGSQREFASADVGSSSQRDFKAGTAKKKIVKHQKGGESQIELFASGNVNRQDFQSGGRSMLDVVPNRETPSGSCMQGHQTVRCKTGDFIPSIGRIICAVNKQIFTKREDNPPELEQSGREVKGDGNRQSDIPSGTQNIQELLQNSPVGVVNTGGFDGKNKNEGNLPNSPVVGGEIIKSEVDLEDDSSSKDRINGFVNGETENEVSLLDNPSRGSSTGDFSSGSGNDVGNDNNKNLTNNGSRQTFTSIGCNTCDFTPGGGNNSEIDLKNHSVLGSTDNSVGFAPGEKNESRYQNNRSGGNKSAYLSAKGQNGGSRQNLPSVRNGAKTRSNLYQGRSRVIQQKYSGGQILAKKHLGGGTSGSKINFDSENNQRNFGVRGAPKSDQRDLGHGGLQRIIGNRGVREAGRSQVNIKPLGNHKDNGSGSSQRGNNEKDIDPSGMRRDYGGSQTYFGAKERDFDARGKLDDNSQWEFEFGENQLFQNMSHKTLMKSSSAMLPSRRKDVRPSLPITEIEIPSESKKTLEKNLRSANEPIFTRSITESTKDYRRPFNKSSMDMRNRPSITRSFSLNQSSKTGFNRTILKIPSIQNRAAFNLPWKAAIPKYQRIQKTTTFTKLSDDSDENIKHPSKGPPNNSTSNHHLNNRSDSTDEDDAGSPKRSQRLKPPSIKGSLGGHGRLPSHWHPLKSSSEGGTLKRTRSQHEYQNDNMTRNNSGGVRESPSQHKQTTISPLNDLRYTPSQHVHRAGIEAKRGDLKRYPSHPGQTEGPLLMANRYSIDMLKRSLTHAPRERSKSPRSNSTSKQETTQDKSESPVPDLYEQIPETIPSTLSLKRLMEGKLCSIPKSSTSQERELTQAELTTLVGASPKLHHLLGQNYAHPIEDELTEHQHHHQHQHEVPKTNGGISVPNHCLRTPISLGLQSVLKKRGAEPRIIKESNEKRQEQDTERRRSIRFKDIPPTP